RRERMQGRKRRAKSAITDGRATRPPRYSGHGADPDGGAPKSQPSHPVNVSNSMPLVPASPPPLHFFDSTPQALDDVFAGWGWPKFRGRQVREWVYGKLVADPALMSNLAVRDRDLLRGRVEFSRAQVTSHQSSSDGT